MGITVGRLTPRWPRWPKVALVTRETLPSTPRLSTECSTPDPASPDPRPSALSTASSPAHCPAALLLHPCPQIEVFGRKFEKSQMGGDKHGVYWQQQQPDIFASHPPTSNIECRQPLHPLSRLMTPGSSRTNLRKRRNLQCCLPWLGLLALEVRGERLEVRLQPAG